jgi:predicted alpha/beta hydrolase
MNFEIEELTIHAGDGFPLAATVFHSASPTMLSVVVAPALGVPRKFYAHFGRYLAQFNISTVTFDYRGFGESGPAWRSDAAVPLGDLGRLDLMAVLSFAHAANKTSNLCFVGHSFGVMAFAVAPNAALVSRAISVAAGSAYYRFHPFPRSLVHLFFWSIVAPQITHLHGYFPGRRLGILGDMPQLIVEDVARCCLVKDYLKGAIAQGDRAAYHGDIWALSFSDDGLCPCAAVDDFHESFPTARVRRSHLLPEEIGRKRVGHIGAFLSGSCTLWDEMIQWLLAGTLLPPRDGDASLHSEHDSARH